MKLFGLLIFISFIAGYLTNFYWIVKSVGFSGLLVLRIIGIFAPPLGAFMGFIPV